MQGFTPVIGLEIHARLRTRTKAFCGCAAAYGGEPNSRTCPVCLGHPGALPVLNAEAVRLAVRAALALGADVHTRSVFSRKHYFYPDLPKGYQITQYDRPLATGGAVLAVGLSRIHIEEDAGKTIHDGFPDSHLASYVDFNRAGIPLIEIVSEPEIRSPEEVHLCLVRLRSILRYTGVCDGFMEQGSLRCDANVSVRQEDGSPGTPVELKNLNTFRGVRRGLDYEVRRQSGILRSGGEVARETVLWDAAAGMTRPMRSKEQAPDYRYFPEPDLPPLDLDPRWIEEIRKELPMLPDERKRRMIDDHRLSEEEAEILSRERALADYHEEVAGAPGDPAAATNRACVGWPVRSWTEIPGRRKRTGKVK